MAAWTLDDVRSLIDHRIQERIDLEFKSALPGSREQLARWIAAMANTGGGTIVYGVQEDTHGRAIAPTPVSLDRVADTVFEVAANDIDEPAIVQVTELDDDRAKGEVGYVVIDVVDSDRAPHFVAGVAWGRTEQTIRRLKRSELVRLFAGSRGFADESGLAADLQKPADVVADIQRAGTGRVLIFRNLGDRVAYGVRWQHLAAGETDDIRPTHDPFPVQEMPPLVTYEVRGEFRAASLPAKIRVWWQDERGSMRENLVVVT